MAQGYLWPANAKVRMSQRNKLSLAREDPLRDTENSGSDNKWSVQHDLAGCAKKDDMEQKFCMKTLSNGILYWPKGKYCILKKGPYPKGW